MSFQDKVAIAMTALVGINLIWTVYWSIVVRGQLSKSQNDERLNDHGDRLTALETEIKRLPAQVSSHGDVEKVHTRVGAVKDTLSDLKESVGELTGMVKGLRESVAALNNHHMGVKK